MIRIQEILDKVSASNPNADLELIQKAYVFAATAHAGQTRLSGEPYLSHPLAVASILAEMGFDEPTISAGLLHDTVEDTELSFEQLRAFVPEEVIAAIALVTKQGKVDYLEYIDGLIQQNNVTAMQVKYCDLMHNIDPSRGSSPLPHKMAIYAQAMQKLALHVTAL